MSSKEQYKELMSALVDSVDNQVDEELTRKIIRDNYIKYLRKTNPTEKALYGSPEEYEEYLQKERQKQLEEKQKLLKEKQKIEEAMKKAREERVKREYEEIFGKSADTTEKNKTVELTIHKPAGKRLIKLE